MSTTHTPNTNTTTDAVTDALYDIGFDVQNMQITPGHKGYGAIVICKNAAVARDRAGGLRLRGLLHQPGRRQHRLGRDRGRTMSTTNTTTTTPQIYTAAEVDEARRAIAGAEAFTPEMKDFLADVIAKARAIVDSAEAIFEANCEAAEFAAIVEGV
jgi:hypothetical protein